MSAQPSRLAWIDVLRGVAVVGMVETHVLHTFLSAEHDEALWLQHLNFYNGLVASTFLWIAGYVQGLAMRSAQAKQRPVATARRWRRLGLVALIGYLMHAPWWQWLQGDFGPETWSILFQVDILQCMAFSLGLLLCVGALFGHWLLDAVTLFLALASIFLAPYAAGWTTGLVPVDMFLNSNGGSLFPLFPWVGFCAAGCLASRWEPSWKVYVPVSLALMAAGYYLAPDFWSKSHPAFFAERLGYMGMLIAAVCLVSRWLAPKWLQLAGRESLFVYVAHLVILFTLPVAGLPQQGIPLNIAIGRTLQLPAVAGMFAAVLGICLALAYLNEKRKRRDAPVVSNRA